MLITPDEMDAGDWILSSYLSNSVVACILVGWRLMSLIVDWRMVDVDVVAVDVEVVARLVFWSSIDNVISSDRRVMVITT